MAKNATPNQRKINGKPLTQDVQLTATGVHAVTPEILRIEIPDGQWMTRQLHQIFRKKVHFIVIIRIL